MPNISAIIAQLKQNAHKNTSAYCHMCAVISGGKIVSIGFNNNRNFIFDSIFTSCHAEMDAIYKIKNLSKFILFSR